VIFTFGLAELVRQLVTYYEVNVTRTLGRYVFLPIGPEHIYWQLLGLLAVTLALAFWISRAKIGLALRVIGDDPVVASHLGVRITRTKLALFSLSAVVMTLAGAIQAPRWTYIEPSIVFNPTVSFLTVIMALLGGPNRLLGPLLGAVPLFLLFEWLSANFPNHYSIILGLLFIAIVFLLPNGVLAAWDKFSARFKKEARA
jgi:branched-chain amino acid transport system permease protein